MSAHGEAGAFHALNAGFARAAAVVAGLLLATAIAAAAEPPLKPHAIACTPGDGDSSEKGTKLYPPIYVGNSTGRTIPAGTRIEITVCTVAGCRKVNCCRTIERNLVPGDVAGFVAGPGVLSCTATVMLPPDFKEKARKHEIPKYSRSRPPGPPGPGLLEPGYPTEPHKPSGIGTAKPSAPPPFISR